ncbi:MAG: hypothetical protein CM1200mP36_06730 [Gammaproteobacteria bacterium]|nr:MAG: hypothetical protein CM1200mP36_06730 [Gammaproteobacteria bacterium]
MLLNQPQLHFNHGRLGAASIDELLQDWMGVRPKLDNWHKPLLTRSIRSKHWSSDLTILRHRLADSDLLRRGQLRQTRTRDGHGLS